MTSTVPSTGPSTGPDIGRASDDSIGERLAALEDRRDRDSAGTANRPSVKKRTAYWTRWLHVYTSMFALLITLFFGITGITLNHPDWTFGDDVELTTLEGTLPDTVLVDGEIEFLMVSEYLRTVHEVSGEVADFSAIDGQGTISYKAPGYGADVFFDPSTLDYSLTIQQQGFVAVMNDLHKGRDASTSWRWIIDISAGFLVAISITGLGVQIFMRKRRTRALILSGLGGVVAVIFIWSAMG